jgi:hypothetical protein
MLLCRAAAAARVPFNKTRFCPVATAYFSAVAAVSGSDAAGLAGPLKIPAWRRNGACFFSVRLQSGAVIALVPREITRFSG